MAPQGRGRVLGALFGIAGCGSPAPGVDGGTDAVDAVQGADIATPVDALGDALGADGDGATAVEPNVVPVVVDPGPMGTTTVDTLYVSITLCRPGTSTCQTIDHVQVDTGSTGLRVQASVLDPALGLGHAPAPSGSGTLVECYAFADGFTWGPVATADLAVGGESAHGVALQVIGDPAFATVPARCSSSGPPADTVADFGANGIIGIGTSVADCGADCADPTSPYPGAYYACTSARCTVAVVPAAQQVQNPITLFPVDHNGSVIQLPAIAPDGQATARGSLVFGIGTRDNNALGSATVLTVDELNGYFTTTFDGQTLDQSYIDSGSNAYYVTDAMLPGCTGANAGFACPSATRTLMATNTGLNGMSAAVTFRVESANTLFRAAGDAAYDDLAGPGSDGSFAWGLPFFFGRSVFTAVDGASTPGGAGPYFAY